MKRRADLGALERATVHRLEVADCVAHRVVRRGPVMGSRDRHADDELDRRQDVKSPCAKREFPGNMS